MNAGDRHEVTYKVFPVKLSRSGLVEAAGNLLLAVLYLFFAYSFLMNFVRQGRTSSLLFMIVETVFLYFALTRRPSRQTSRSFVVWFFAFAGSFLPLLLRAVRTDEEILGYAVQATGSFLIGLSILSLGKSFGIVSANRGIVTNGMYRFVRHPLYMSYTVNIFGFLLNNFTLVNLLLFVFGTLAQLMRIRHEEALLIEDREYQEYATMTKWRLLPFIY